MPRKCQHCGGFLHNETNHTYSGCIDYLKRYYEMLDRRVNEMSRVFNDHKHNTWAPKIPITRVRVQSTVFEDRDVQP
jgi:hypothetical protein